jgi:hypothetical protein
MAYNSFSLTTLIRQFALDVREVKNMFAGVAPAVLSDLLRQTLDANISLALDISTEKARSELIIAPVLVEVRRQLPGRISLFSGVEFNVDTEKGLVGVCDFLLSLSPLQLAIQAPVVTVVEAKNENMKAGIAQCIAEMIAAQQFNQEQGNTLPIIYGVVTTGSAWRFLQLDEKTVSVDSEEYPIGEVEKILGILLKMVGQPDGATT